MQMANLAGVNYMGGIRCNRSGRMGRMQAVPLLRSRRHCDGERGDIFRGAAYLWACRCLRLRNVSEGMAGLTRNLMVAGGNAIVLTPFVAVFPRGLGASNGVMWRDAGESGSLAGNRSAD